MPTDRPPAPLDEAARETRIIAAARAARGFADGYASILLARYLDGLGLTAAQIGVVVTATLLGSAALTLWVGLRWSHHSARTTLLGACVLMGATGLGFSTVTAYGPLLVVAFVGTLNPSGGDVSMFLPVEQSALADRVSAQRRPAVFATYNLVGAFAAALGALVSGAPDRIAAANSWDVTTVQRWSFLVYVVVAGGSALLYRRLAVVAAQERRPAGRPALAQSRRVVYRLAALFSLDSAGGGMAINALLVVYLDSRFGLSPSAMATTFAAAGVLGALSQLLSVRLAARIGLVNTMVFTHLPANLFLIAAGIVPSAGVAVACLLLRASMSSMDIPARQALVMNVVPPEERAAAASVTNVPRSLAAATTPALAGLLLARSTFGWPLIIAGALKAIYDLLLLAENPERAPV